MAINLKRFFCAIGGIGMVGKAARVNSPAICFGLALRNPFGYQLARTASLDYPKGKGTGFKRVWHARHRAN